MKSRPSLDRDETPGELRYSRLVKSSMSSPQDLCERVSRVNTLVILDKPFPRAQVEKKCKKAGKIGKLAYFGKCDKIGVLKFLVTFI
jgi:hypothetical protein